MVAQPQATSKPITLEAWAELDEDDTREWVDGRLEDGEEPDGTHETVVMWLAGALLPWLKPLGGRAMGSGLKYAVSASRGRMPDFSVFLPGAGLPPPRGIVRSPPDIAVEVVTPTARDERRDRTEKLLEHAAFGVRWYWIVDPAARSFEIFAREASGHYARVVALESGVIGEVQGCPGLVLDIDALWQDVESLEPPIS